MGEAAAAVAGVCVHVCICVHVCSCVHVCVCVHVCLPQTCASDGVAGAAPHVCVRRAHDERAHLAVCCEGVDELRLRFDPSEAQARAE